MIWRWAYGCKSRDLTKQQCLVVLGVTHLFFINSQNFLVCSTQKRSKKPLKAKVLKIKNSDESLHLRRLTVSSQSVVNKKSSNGLKPIPFLRLMGVWLDQAGFPINSQVDVIVDNNLLIIKPADS